VGTVLRVRIRYGCSNVRIAGQCDLHHTNYAWACVSVDLSGESRHARRLAEELVGNRPDPRRLKSYLPNHAQILAAAGSIEPQYVLLSNGGCDDESIGQRNSSTPFESVRGIFSGAGFAARSVPLQSQAQPSIGSVESLPPDVRSYGLRVKSIVDLGFEPVGYVNVGSMTEYGQLHGAVQQFATLEWRTYPLSSPQQKMAGYIEFITRCSNDAQVDTNTNSVAPFLFPSPS